VILEQDDCTQEELDSVHAAREREFERRARDASRGRYAHVIADEQAKHIAAVLPFEPRVCESPGWPFAHTS
jgi:hypothetical protein